MNLILDLGNDFDTSSFLAENGANEIDIRRFPHETSSNEVYLVLHTEKFQVLNILSNESKYVVRC